MRLRGAFAVVALSALIADANPCRADASFELNGQAHEFTEVSAFRIRSRRDPTRYRTFVLLTRTAPDRDAIAKARDPLTAAINDAAAKEGSVSLSVAPDGRIGMNADIDGVQFLDSTGPILGQPGSLAGECSVNSETRVACTITTPKPVKTASGQSWTFQATFDTEVLKPPGGEPVAAGGGAPGKALLSLQAALAGDALDAILAHMSKKQAEEYRATWRTPAESLAAVKEDLGRQLPKKLTVTGGQFRSDHEVELLVQGTLAGVDEPALYSVTMVNEGGQWGYDGSRFVGFAN